MLKSYISTSFIYVCVYVYVYVYVHIHIQATSAKLAEAEKTMTTLVSSLKVSAACVHIGVCVSCVRPISRCPAL